MANTKIPAELSSTPSISDGGNATAITIDSSENVAITGSLSASKLSSNNGVLELDDNGSHNGIINVPASLSINIDSDNGATTESFTVSKDKTGIDDTDVLFRVMESGNVAIGTITTFSNPLTLNKAAGAAGSLNNQLSMTHTGSDRAFHLKTIRAAATDNPDGLAFVVNTTERARIETDGNFKINTVAGNGKLLVATGGGSTSDWGARLLMGSSAATSYLVDFIDHQGQRMGSIQGSTTANTVTYLTSSDYRLKENVDYTWDATTRLKQLKPARFNWIRDESNTLVDGFLAHEVEDIVPEAISGEKDATETWTNAVVNSYGKYIADNVTEEQWLAGKEDGVYDEDTTWSASHTQDLHQSIDQAKLVPLLTKALQEQQTLIEDLQARIETLEG